MHRVLLALSLAVLLLACPKPDNDSGQEPGDTDTDSDADTDTDTDADTDTDTDPVMGDAPYPGDVIGWVRVLEQNWGGHDPYGRVYAELWDGIQPGDQEPMAQEGECMLLDGPRIYDWSCDPPCEHGQVCVGGECVDYPSLVPSGTLTVSGLSSGEVTLEPGTDGRYPVSYDWPADIFDVNQPVTLRSTGGATPALDLSAWGVETLVAEVETINPGQDMLITWQPPAEDEHSRIQLLLETGWHGSSSMTTIWCDAADDGELTVPASLTAEFDIPSCGECGESFIARYTQDSVDFGDGPVQLFVASQMAFVAWW